MHQWRIASAFACLMLLVTWHMRKNVHSALNIFAQLILDRARALVQKSVTDGVAEAKSYALSTAKDLTQQSVKQAVEAANGFTQSSVQQGVQRAVGEAKEIALKAAKQFTDKGVEEAVEIANRFTQKEVRAGVNEAVQRAAVAVRRDRDKSTPWWLKLFARF